MYFSVIIPTFRRPAKLLGTLESLFKQTLKESEFEILVCDNDHPEPNAETKALVADLAKKHPNLVYLWEPKPGPAAARNIGIQSARGLVCAFTDDDVIVPPEWLEKIKEGFEKYPDVVGVGGRMEPPSDWVRSNPVARHELYMTREFYNLNPNTKEFISGKEAPIGATNNIAYKTEALRKVGGFDDAFLPHIYGEEKDLKERLIKNGYTKLLYIPTYVIHKRRYDWKSFLSHSFNDGIGTRFYNQQNNIKTNRFRLLVHLGISTALLPVRLVYKKDRFLELMKLIYKYQATAAQVLPEKMIIKVELE